MSESAPQPSDDEPIDWEAAKQLPPIPVPEGMPPHLPTLDPNLRVDNPYER